MSSELIRTKPPAKPADVPLRIYSNPICPFAHRARLAAAFKEVKHEIIQIHLKDKPQWYLEDINEFGKVPTIEHDGHIIRESAVILDYIDEVFEGKKLWPSDPYKKAQSKLVLNDFGEQFIPNYYKYYRNAQDENTVTNIIKFVKSVENIISQYGGPFIMGNEVSAIDLLIWPWFERLIFPDVREKFTEDNVPLMIKWEKAMREVDAVKKTSRSADLYRAFAAKFKETGAHDYSVLNIDGLKIYVK